MSSKPTKTVRRYLQTAYNETIRPRLPRKYGVYAGVPVRNEGLLDAVDHHPNYKRGLVDAIRETVEDGDTVVLVGGGRGVSTVHCLRAGADEVIAFEAAAEMIETAAATVRAAEVPGRAEFRHALVGEAVEVYGDLGGADVVAPDELPDGDVLVMDCEGAERSILEGAGDLPETVIVETHPERGVPTGPTETLLADAGYDVTARQYEPDQAVADKRILVGRRTA